MRHTTVLGLASFLLAGCALFQPYPSEYERLLGTWYGYYGDGTREWKVLMTFTDIRREGWVDGRYVLDAKGGPRAATRAETFAGKRTANTITIGEWMTLEWDGMMITGTGPGVERPAHLLLIRRPRPPSIRESFLPGPLKSLYPQ